jgi:hypothetical protein
MGQEGGSDAPSDEAPDWFDPDAWDDGTNGTSNEDAYVSVACAGSGGLGHSMNGTRLHVAKPRIAGSTNEDGTIQTTHVLQQ